MNIASLSQPGSARVALDKPLGTMVCGQHRDKRALAATQLDVLLERGRAEPCCNFCKTMGLVPNPTISPSSTFW